MYSLKRIGGEPEVVPTAWSLRIRWRLRVMEGRIGRLAAGKFLRYHEKHVSIFGTNEVCRHVLLRY